MSTRFRSSRTVAAVVLAAAAVLGVLLARPAIGQGVSHPSPPAALRVMTYNIQHGARPDGSFDLDGTAAAIRAQRPDVVALQEVDATWDARSNFVDEPAALARALRMHAYLAPIYDTPPTTVGAADRRYGVAILSRYPIVRTEDHQITRLSTQVPNAVPVPAPGFAEIAIRVGHTEVHVYDTHLDYRADPSVRVTQVAETRQYLNTDPAPSILMGDLNATPDSAELQPLLADISDVFARLGRVHPPSYPATAPTDAIDFVLVSKEFTVRDARIVDTLASDHRPQVADLVLPRR